MNTDKILKLIGYFVGLPKSIYVNFKLLPFRQAIYLPIIVSRKTKLISINGKVNLKRIKLGIVRIGFTGADMIDYKYNRTILKINGILNINGKVKIGKGSRFIVYGELTLGNNFITTGDTTVICNNKISIDENTMIAWESIIMDTDQHTIYDKYKRHINPDGEIIIGKNVWIGARCFILKNTTIKDGCIIGANTILTKSFKNKNSIIAGTPPRIIKEDITWEH